MMFSFVVAAPTTTSGVARLLSGDQGTGVTLRDGLRKRKGEGRHQGKEEELRMHGVMMYKHRGCYKTEKSTSASTPGTFEVDKNREC